MKDAKGHGSNPRGAHAEGVDQIGQPLPKGEYDIRNDVRDAHGNELYGTVRAATAAFVTDTKQYVGKIDYGAITGYKPEVSIHMIEVDPAHRGQGVASKMMDKLREEFTENGKAPKINWGMTTPEGTAFKKAYLKGMKK